MPFLTLDKLNSLIMLSLMYKLAIWGQFVLSRALTEIIEFPLIYKTCKLGIWKKAID